ncbi:MAG: helix-turn-helix transcriptional regulator, partial [Pseudomonadota bacterium]|nr:helix-turn-helix transcriptional regulator [Pseudomonadota bacterium]
RQHFQMTPAAYIRQRRLERAQDLLRRQQLSIGEAAYLAGYRHPSNFITAYKRAFGTTPGEL